MLFVVSIMFDEIPTTSVGDAVVKCAEKQLGKPYVAGGAGPNNFDCSGLVIYCYKKAGMSIPRVSRDQCAKGRQITQSQAQPGDPICFFKQGSPVHHVGIVTSFDQMIHAPHTGDVVKRASQYSQGKAISIKYVTFN